MSDNNAAANVGAAPPSSLLPKMYSSVAEVERDLHFPHDPSPPAPPQSWAATDRPAPHLFLHFDVNETILVGDPAGGDTAEECLDKIIAKSAFVSITPMAAEGKNEGDDGTDRNDDRGGDDVALPRSPSSGDVSAEAAGTHCLTPTRWWNGAPLDPACDGGDARDQAPPPLYTGWIWPPATCPYYRTACRGGAKRFTRTAHGRIYRPLFEHLRERLGVTRDDGDGVSRATGSFENFLPAFFHTLRHYFPSATVSNEAADRLRPPSRVTLILRTFGTDLPQVAKAISEFARGNHPSHPDYHNEDLILEEADLLRSGWRHDPGAESNRREIDFIYELYPAVAGGRSDRIISGDEAVLDHLQSQTIVGIQDCYPFWRDHRHAPWAGKPVWAGTEAAACRRDHHHILLDDNIHNDPEDGAGGVRVPVVAARHHDGATGDGVATYAALPGTAALALHGTHLLRVPTVRPLLEEDWFIRQIEAARRRMRARGGPTE